MKKSLQIHKKKTHSIERKHPWIFSGAISSNVEDFEDGDLVTVYDHKEKVIAKGHFQHATISIRVLTFEDEEIDQPFFDRKIGNAIKVRRNQQLFREDNNICRLVHG